MCDGAAQAVQLGPALFVLTGEVGDAGVQGGFGFRLFVAHGAQAFGELRVGHPLFVERLIQLGDLFGINSGGGAGKDGGRENIHPAPDAFQRCCNPPLEFRNLLHRLAPFLSSKSS
jgi:hypothetical protein